MSNGLNWTEEQLSGYLAKFKNQGDGGSAVSAADVEPTADDGPTTANVGQEVHPRFHIRVHSKRRRLADPDGISAKYAIDGLVKGGLLPDDSTEYVESVSFTQEKSEIEETVIDIYEVLR